MQQLCAIPPETGRHTWMGRDGGRGGEKFKLTASMRSQTSQTGPKCLSPSQPWQKLVGCMTHQRTTLQYNFVPNLSQLNLCEPSESHFKWKPSLVTLPTHCEKLSLVMVTFQRHISAYSDPSWEANYTGSDTWGWRQTHQTKDTLLPDTGTCDTKPPFSWILSH